MALCGALAVAALALRIALVARGATLAAYCLTPCRMDALAIGGWVALAVRGPGGLGAVAPAARRAALMTGMALLALAGARLAAYKKPKRIVFRTRLPLSSMGKVVKRELREQLERELASS